MPLNRFETKNTLLNKRMMSYKKHDLHEIFEENANCHSDENDIDEREPAMKEEVFVSVVSDLLIANAWAGVKLHATKKGFGITTPDFLLLEKIKEIASGEGSEPEREFNIKRLLKAYITG